MTAYVSTLTLQRKLIIVAKRMSVRQQKCITLGHGKNEMDAWLVALVQQKMAATSFTAVHVQQNLTLFKYKLNHITK